MKGNERIIMARNYKNDYDTQYFDTYDGMTLEEKNEFLLLQKIKKNIKHFVGIDKIIKKISNNIDNSKNISFASERNKKYISTTKPVFILKLRADFKKELSYPKADSNTYFIDGRTNPIYEEDINLIQDTIYNEVIHDYGSWLMTYLTDNEKFLNILEEHKVGTKHLSKAAMDILIMSSAVMFAIKVDMKNDKVYLEYSI